MRHKPVIIFFVVAIGCGIQVDNSASKSIFGKNDFTVVTQNQLKDDKFARIMGAIVTIWLIPGLEHNVYAEHGCSGFKISEKHIITNKHCTVLDAEQIIFDQGRVSIESMDLVDYHIDNSFRLDFYDEVLKKPTLADLEQKILGEPVFYGGELDFAIYELPESEWGGDFIDLKDLEQDLEKVKKEVRAGREIKSVMYSYPTGAPLLKSHDCQVNQKSDNDQMFTHTCDSLTGSSGGLIVDVNSKIPFAIHFRVGGKTRYDFFEKNGYFREPRETATDHCEKVCENKPSFYEKCLEVTTYNRAIPLLAVYKYIQKKGFRIYE